MRASAAGAADQRGGLRGIDLHLQQQGGAGAEQRILDLVGAGEQVGAGGDRDLVLAARRRRRSRRSRWSRATRATRSMSTPAPAQPGQRGARRARRRPTAPAIATEAPSRAAAHGLVGALAAGFEPRHRGRARSRPAAAGRSTGEDQVEIDRAEARRSWRARPAPPSSPPIRASTDRFPFCSTASPASIRRPPPASAPTAWRRRGGIAGRPRRSPAPRRAPCPASPRHRRGSRTGHARRPAARGSCSRLWRSVFQYHWV